MKHDLSRQGLAISRSAAWAAARPRLSILIPTYDWDVRQLCSELLAQIEALAEPGLVELVVLVDGNPKLVGLDDLLAIPEATPCAAAVAIASSNLGRSAARNSLAGLARGSFLQFLDSDSLPDEADFVRSILAAIGRDDVVICGGRTGKRAPPPPADALLFDVQSRKREWIPAATRNQDPIGNFLSANFAVSRSLYDKLPFDDAFQGWGWEDTDWAIRISRHATIEHIDNPVSHMEHRADREWIERLQGSAANYLALCRQHPEVARRQRLHPMIEAFRKLPREPLSRGLLRRVSLWRVVPPDLRIVCAKMLQAMAYADAIDGRLR